VSENHLDFQPIETVPLDREVVLTDGVTCWPDEWCGNGWFVALDEDAPPTGWAELPNRREDWVGLDIVP